MSVLLLLDSRVRTLLDQQSLWFVAVGYHSKMFGPYGLCCALGGKTYLGAHTCCAYGFYRVLVISLSMLG